MGNSLLITTKCQSFTTSLIDNYLGLLDQIIYLNKDLDYWCAMLSSFGELVWTAIALSYE